MSSVLQEAVAQGRRSRLFWRRLSNGGNAKYAMTLMAHYPNDRSGRSATTEPTGLRSSLKPRPAVQNPPFCAGAMAGVVVEATQGDHDLRGVALVPRLALFAPFLPVVPVPRLCGWRPGCAGENEQSFCFLDDKLGVSSPHCRKHLCSPSVKSALSTAAAR